MAAGLQVFDASGKLTLDLQDRLTVLLGTINVSANGSMPVALPVGTFWALTLPLDDLFAVTANVPEVTYENGSVVWRYTNWSWNTAANRAATIMYGVY